MPSNEILQVDTYQTLSLLFLGGYCFFGYAIAYLASGFKKF